jgi:hypothetical protein
VIALALILASTSALLAGAVITSGVWLHGERKENKNAHDTLNAQDKLILALQLKAKELDETKALLAEKSAQLNKANAAARDFYVALVEKSGADKAGQLVKEMLATPIFDAPSVPRETGDKSAEPTSGDGLIPFAGL